MSTTQHELLLQQQHGELLHAKVESMNTQLVTKEKELKDVSMSNESAVQKLDQAVKHVQQFRIGTASLTAKVVPLS